MGASPTSNKEAREENGQHSQPGPHGGLSVLDTVLISNRRVIVSKNDKNHFSARKRLVKATRTRNTFSSSARARGRNRFYVTSGGVYFLAAFRNAAQPFFCAAAIRLRAAALMVRFTRFRRVSLGGCKNVWTPTLTLCTMARISAICCSTSASGLQGRPEPRSVTAEPVACVG